MEETAGTLIALPSTAGDGDISRIIPMVPHVNHTEHKIRIAITDQRLADLQGQPLRERTKVMIESCAHPDFRGELREYLDRTT